MPRKPTDHVAETRVTLGTYERRQLTQIMNIRSGAIALQGGGLLLAGIGALVAGYAFSKVKMPDIGQNPNLDDDPFNDVPKENYAPRRTMMKPESACI